MTIIPDPERAGCATPFWDGEQAKRMTQEDYDRCVAAGMSGFTKGGKPRPDELISVVELETAEHKIIGSLAGYAAETKHNPACKATAKMGAVWDFERPATCSD